MTIIGEHWPPTLARLYTGITEDHAFGNFCNTAFKNAWKKIMHFAQTIDIKG